MGWAGSIAHKSSAVVAKVCVTRLHFLRPSPTSAPQPTTATTVEFDYTSSPPIRSTQLHNNTSLARPQLETNMRLPVPLLQVYHYTAW